MASEDPLYETRATYLDLVSATVARGMRPLPKDEPFTLDPAIFQSMGWCNRVLTRGANPWLPTNRVTHTFHVSDKSTVDLLEHRLVLDAVPVRILETSSLFLIFVPGNAFPERDPLAKAAHAASMLLRLHAPLTFKSIVSDARHRSFSSDEQVTPERLREWQRRIDGVVLDGDIGLFVFKVTLDQMMQLGSDPRNWFGDLRTAPIH